MAAGVDALGLVLYRESPRYVDLERAAQIIRKIPPFVTVVGLFVDPAVEVVWEALARLRLDLLQFHGAEQAAFCRQFGRPYLKAVCMAPGVDVTDRAQDYGDAVGLLLDAYVPGLVGGTGQVFDWTAIPGDRPLPIVLAGGLNAANVGRAIRAARPDAVDVSGGVERAKGRKDPAQMRAFVEAVRNADEDES